MRSLSGLSTLTLVFALLSLVSSPVAASASPDVVPIHARHRLIKKWGPPPAAVPVVRRQVDKILGLGDKQGDDGTDTTTTPAAGAGGAGTSTGTGSTTGRSTTTAAAGSQTTPAGASSTTPGGLLGGIGSTLGGILGGGSSTSGSTSGSASSTGSTTTTVTVTRTAASTPLSSPTSSSTSTSSTTTATTTTSTPGTIPSLTPQEKEKAETQSRIPHKTMVIIIVVASCLGGAGLIWTVVRKWKFRPSRSFEDRLAPIDWQPAPGAGGAGGMAERNRYSVGGVSARSGSAADATSVRRNMFAPDDRAPSVAPDFPPPHDFTAGPAPLTRGPSGGQANYNQRGYGGYGY